MQGREAAALFLMVSVQTAHAWIPYPLVRFTSALVTARVHFPTNFAGTTACLDPAAIPLATGTIPATARTAAVAPKVALALPMTSLPRWIDARP